MFDSRKGQVSIPVLGPNLSVSKLIRGVSARGLNRRDLNPTTNFTSVYKLRKRGTILTRPIRIHKVLPYLVNVYGVKITRQLGDALSVVKIIIPSDSPLQILLVFLVALLFKENM